MFSLIHYAGVSVAIIIILVIVKKRQRSNEHQNVNLRENEAYGISLPMKVNDAYGCNFLIMSCTFTKKL